MSTLEKETKEKLLPRLDGSPRPIEIWPPILGVALFLFAMVLPISIGIIIAKVAFHDSPLDFVTLLMFSVSTGIYLSVSSSSLGFWLDTQVWKKLHRRILLTSFEKLIPAFDLPSSIAIDKFRQSAEKIGVKIQVSPNLWIVSQPSASEPDRVAIYGGYGSMDQKPLTRENFPELGWNWKD